jgi:hypothetical protein
LSLFESESRSVDEAATRRSLMDNARPCPNCGVWNQKA